MSLFYLTNLLHLNCKSVVTKNGYKPLAINQLSSKKISVTQKDLQSSIAQQLQNTIDTKGNSNLDCNNKVTT
ncbi:conserved hypothetical protein [Lacticaseibacillus paracasei subsp. paracasei]|nr:hypothetical protein C5L26_001915 [Lacticaseibacillus paracasei subsp. paracasei]BAN72961.1 conserved hypothetical protein [Lacticaseibacillus paracasei subsp. paracasei]